MSISVHSARVFLMWTMLITSSSTAAQDLEPRAYSPSPVGTSFIGIGFGRSSGDIAFDPTLPITNANATLYSPALGVGHSFGVFRKQALFTAALPYAWGNVSGDVGDQRGHVYRSGLTDIKGRVSINLRGSPAMTVAEFARRPQRRMILGASLTLTSPAGQYDNTKLINLGTNRWSFKPEVGISYPIKKVDLDLYAGIWFFTPNESFYPGTSRRSQSPLTAFQAHVSYTLRPGLWAAIDATWYGGGASTINGGAPSERQDNSRLGGTLSFPLGNGHSFKLSYSSGVTGSIGSKFNTVAGGWQYVWFRHP